MEAPNPLPRFWVANDVVQWIRANVKDKQDHGQAQEAAKWWCAIESSEGYRDLSLKEMASELMVGIKPMSLEFVTEQIQAEHEGMEETTNHIEVDDYIEQRLRSHFGLKEEP